MAHRINMGGGSSSGGGVTAAAEGVYYPAEAYGCFSLSGAPEAYDQLSVSTGDFFLVRMFVPAGKIIGAVGAAVAIAGTYNGTGTPNQFAVYEDNGTLISTTPDDATLWATDGWRFGVLSTPSPAQGASRFIRVGFTIQGYSGCYWLFHSGNHPGGINGGRNVANQRFVYQGGVTTPPATTPSNYGAVQGYAPLLALAES